MTQHDAGHERAGSALAGLRATDDAALEQALAAPSIPFFPGAGREQLLTQLEHWSRYGNGILIVEGSEQSGKTTLAGELQQRFGNEMTLLSICASGQTQSIDLLIEIADALGIESGLEPDEADLLEKIQQIAQEAQADASAVAIVIDDAHELDEASYHLLFRLAFNPEDNQPLISVILLSLPGIDLWRNVPEGMAWPTLAVLRPLDFEEALEFWRHCRQQSGGSADAIEDSRTARRLWADAEGLPGNLLRRFPDQKESVAAAVPSRAALFSLPNWHLLAIVAVGLLLAAVLWFGNRESAPPEQQSLSIALPTEPAVPVVPLPAAPPSSEAQPAPATLPPPMPPVSTPIASEQPAVVPAPVPAPLPKPKVIPAPVEPPKAVEKPKPAPVKEPAKASKPATPPKQAVAAVPAPKATLATPEVAQQHQKLLALAPERFTLQLLGASDLSKVRNYIDRELGCKDCYYYETRRDGKPWFTVVKGVYADRAAAVAARDKLPAKVRAQQPWPRSVRDIQKELRQQR